MSACSFKPIPSELARMAGVLLSLVVCVAGGVLGGRRFAGALTLPLDAVVLAAVATGAALAAALARFAWRSGSPQRPGKIMDHAALAAPTAGILLLGYGLTPPDSPFWAKALFWTFLVSEEAASGWWAFRRGHAPWPGQPRLGGATSKRRLPSGEQLTQRLSRSKTADGVEWLRGSVRADFAPGSSAARIHVAFCPPMSRLPRFEFHQSSGPPSRITLGRLLPHGARLELKLTGPAREAVTVWVEFTASEKSAAFTGIRGRDRP
ncbi:MAG TPA: hypothetical protein VND64_27165 [Pirellulales bacterium]|nr:hypothetical protein [Pirellulales bacterium]